MSILDAVSTVVLALLTAVAGAASILLLSRRTPPVALLGAVLVVGVGGVPLLLAYGFGVGVIGVTLGGAVAAVWVGRKSTWARRGVNGIAVVWLAVEPLLLLTAFQIRSDETFSRCAADRAVAVVESSRSSGQGYPASMYEIGQQDGGYGQGSCYVGNGTNWLYRVDTGGTYTLGYWVDWRVARRVCIHRAGESGWSCGFESWGPFRPGERD